MLKYFTTKATKNSSWNFIYIFFICCSTWNQVKHIWYRSSLYKLVWVVVGCCAVQVRVCAPDCTFIYWPCTAHTQCNDENRWICVLIKRCFFPYHILTLRKSSCTCNKLKLMTMLMGMAHCIVTQVCWICISYFTWCLFFFAIHFLFVSGWK